MDLSVVLHLVVLPVEVFCVGVVHGEAAAAGFVFTLTTSDQAEGHCLWCTRCLVPGDQGTGYCSTGVMYSAW